MWGALLLIVLSFLLRSSVLVLGSERGIDAEVPSGKRDVIRTARGRSPQVMMAFEVGTEGAEGATQSESRENVTSAESASTYTCSWAGVYNPPTTRCAENQAYMYPCNRRVIMNFAGDYQACQTECGARHSCGFSLFSNISACYCWEQSLDGCSLVASWLGHSYTGSLDCSVA